MSDDLISRKEVLQILYDIKDNDDIPKNYGTLLDIVRNIREIQTAFDKGKVVDDLEALKEMESRNMNDEAAMAYTYAIGIVEKGGIE